MTQLPNTQTASTTQVKESQVAYGNSVIRSQSGNGQFEVLTPGRNPLLSLGNLLRLFEGVKFSQNAMFLFLFGGFMLWLWVVYFIRHHEPAANQVLGLPSTHVSSTDRMLVEGIRTAIPINTGPSTGVVYVPNSVSGAGGAQAALPTPQSTSSLTAPSGISGANAPVNSIPALQYGLYNVPSSDGVRVKTIVNR